MQHVKKTRACTLYKKEREQCNVWITLKQRIWYKNGKKKIENLICARTTILGSICNKSCKSYVVGVRHFKKLWLVCKFKNKSVLQGWDLFLRLFYFCIKSQNERQKN